MGCQVPKIECEDHAVRRRESHIVTFETSKGPGDGISLLEGRFEQLWDNLFYAHNCPIAIVRGCLNCTKEVKLVVWTWAFQKASWLQVVEKLEFYCGGDASDCCWLLTYAICLLREKRYTFPSKSNGTCRWWRQPLWWSLFVFLPGDLSLSSSSLSCSAGFWGQYQ